MWICKTCNKEHDEWVDKCETCNISRNSNDSITESKTEEKSEEINNSELKFTTLRSYANIGYILAGIEILFTLFTLSTFYNIGGVEVMFILMVMAISVALTIIIFTIIGNLILVFLDIEENTRHTSEKLDKLFDLTDKIIPGNKN